MPKAFLQIVSGARQGLNVPLEDDTPLVVGRKRGDLLLDDPLVSSTHCRIMLRDKGWILQDLGSTNGTMVDGRLVRETTLRPGAEITIGGSRMLLFIGDEFPQEALAGERPGLSQLDIAWLLDEELVELRGSSERTRTQADVIGQDLRLPPGLNATVEVVAGQDVGKVFRFTRGNVTIGRRQGEVPLSDVEVSRHHAVIEVFGREMVFLRDLGSTNGTYHNGRRVTVCKLQSGDTIGCGKTVMKLGIQK
ncbi:MAG: FHA domain-containing protein [Deltaproteobacteria bacterium]|nr:FHA domain-containing protein [Deltaproteobacteria bacterium]MBW2254577.1 FHA domain-containing protein [Deltaproteobacteria bacterium]